MLAAAFTDEKSTRAAVKVRVYAMDV